MGTNYYLYKDNIQPLHIGKSSAGWHFALRIYPHLKIKSLDDWIKFIDNSIIKDEYEKEISKEEFLKIVKERKSTLPFDRKNWTIGGHRNEKDFHLKNESERGFNNLIRAKIDGKRCVSHGEGTWDYFDCEFS